MTEQMNTTVKFITTNNKLKTYNRTKYNDKSHYNITQIHTNLHLIDTSIFLYNNQSYTMQSEQQQQQQQQQNQLLYYWVSQELQHIGSSYNNDELTSSSSLSSRNQAPSYSPTHIDPAHPWRSLLSHGLLQNLLHQLDPQYFPTHPSTTQQPLLLLHQHWTSLNQYLVTRHNTQINPSFLQQQLSISHGGRQLTTKSRQLTRRGSNDVSVEGSVVEWVRVVFYLLVGKFTNENGDSGSNDNEDGDGIDNDNTNSSIIGSSSNNQPDNNTPTPPSHPSLKHSTTSLNQTLSSSHALCDGSLSFISPNQQSIQQPRRSSASLGLAESHLYVADTNEGCEGENCEEGEGNYKEEGEGFLQRVCELPQQVQEYLVGVVEQVKNNDIIVPVGSIESLQSVKSNNQQQSTPTHHTSAILSSSPSPPNNQSFKKIFYKQIQQASEQNEELKSQIELIIDENYKLEKQIESNLAQQTHLLNTINHYTQQKQQLFQYLRLQHGIGITSLQEFIDIAKHIEEQNELLQNTIAEIEERNYQLEMGNAQKVHSIERNAEVITRVNEEISVMRGRIRGLKEDIEYLDEFVNKGEISAIRNANNSNSNKKDYDNNNGYLGVWGNAQMVVSFDVQRDEEMLGYGDEDRVLQNEEEQEEEGNGFSFNKSFDISGRHSFGNALKENNDIYNEKMPLKSSTKPHNNNKPKHNRILTDSITNYGTTNNRLSLQSTHHKPSTHRKNLKSTLLQVPNNQQNIDPSPFEHEQQYSDDQSNTQFNTFAHHPSKSHSHLSINYQQQQQQKQIQQQKEKYRQQLVNSLEQLYKEIADLTKGVTLIKEENRVIEKRNQGNQRKVKKLKALHEAFVKEAYKE